MKFRVDLDVFGMAMFFFLGEKEKERYLKATHYENKNVTSDCKGLNYNNAIWLSTLDLSVLIHEIHHAKHFLVTTIGIHDEETEAYIMTYVFKEALRKIKRLDK